MRTGIATMPLDYGKCPKWLFERMKRLGRSILIVIVEEFGPDEVLKRLSNPVWFQALGCVLGFDFNSSGLTTTTLGAIKAGLFAIQDELGIYVCGGKGRTSRKTPQEIETYGLIHGFAFTPNLTYASRMAAKIDSALIQDNYQIYHHNFIFTKSGKWCVVQQGLNAEDQTARRYHWLSSQVKDFVEEPHSGIASQIKVKPLNLTAKESSQNREISTQLVKDGPKTFLKDINLIQTKKQGQLTLMEMPDVEFYHHPVEKEKFDLKRLEKTIFLAHQFQPQNFEELLRIKGIGPRTIRALSLVGEIIYGAKPSYEDPARYSFSHGGKNGTPYFPRPQEMDLTTELLEKGIKKSNVRYSEKLDALRRLNQTYGLQPTLHPSR